MNDEHCWRDIHRISWLSPEEARLPERVQELEGVDSIISMRPEITFQVGEPNSPWYFEFNKAIVNAPINDLLDRSDGLLSWFSAMKLPPMPR